MKNKNASIISPLFVSIIFLLLSHSERLLQIFASGNDDLMLAATVVQVLVFTLPAAFYLKIRGLSFGEHTLFNLPKLSTLPFVLSSALTYFFTAVIIFYIQSNFFPSIEMGGTLSGTGSLRGVILALVIIPAFCEELFFRSIILNDYKGFSGPVSVIISALFFAMLHFSWGGFIFYFSMGVILGTVTFVTGSSIPSLIIHIVNNTLTIFFSSALTSFIEESSSSIILAFILVVLFMGSLVLMLSAMEEIYEKKSFDYENKTLIGSRLDEIKKLSRAGSLQKSDSKKKEANAFLSPTFFVSIIIFLLITLEIL